MCLEEAAPMRQELSPVTYFHKEVQERVSIHSPVKLVVYVNKIEFIRQREACARVMANLRNVFPEINGYLQHWHLLEFGKITLIEDHPEGERDWSNTWQFLEDMFWDTYTISYTELMKDTH